MCTDNNRVQEDMLSPNSLAIDRNAEEGMETLESFLAEPGPCMSTDFNTKNMYIHVQWNLSNLDTIGREKSVLIREVSLFWRVKHTQAMYLGRENVSCLERCP